MTKIPPIPTMKFRLKKTYKHFHSEQADYIMQQLFIIQDDIGLCGEEWVDLPTVDEDGEKIK